VGSVLCPGRAIPRVLRFTHRFQAGSLDASRGKVAKGFFEVDQYRPSGDKRNSRKLLTIRCTRKLLKYFPVQSPTEITPTTSLGDWYANLLFTGTCDLSFV
jgi:hypothetical protein